jgi:hypothetical protein
MSPFKAFNMVRSFYRNVQISLITSAIYTIGVDTPKNNYAMRWFVDLIEALRTYNCGIAPYIHNKFFILKIYEYFVDLHTLNVFSTKRNQLCSCEEKHDIVYKQAVELRKEILKALEELNDDLFKNQPLYLVQSAISKKEEYLESQINKYNALMRSMILIILQRALNVSIMGKYRMRKILKDVFSIRIVHISKAYSKDVAVNYIKKSECLKSVLCEEENAMLRYCRDTMINKKLDPPPMPMAY